MKRLVLLLTALATALAFSVPAVAAQSDDPSAASDDYLIVTLTGEGAAYDNTASTNGRFDPNSQGYARILDRMERQHERFAAQLARKAPEAEIINEFFVTANALTVKLNGADPNAIGSINGVQSTQRSTLYKLDMNESVGLIGADSYWGELGGPSDAGSGVDVAIIDSGIDATHPFFDCEVDGGSKVNFGGIYYSGQGILPQVPSASALFGPGYTPGPGDPLYFFSDHGTHVAGTVGGCAETTINITDPEDFSDVWNGTTLSGVAPGARMFDYNVFPFIGAGVVAFGGSAFSHDIAEAIEDAVEDDMDVINMSLGGGVQGPHDFLAEVSNGAVAAGVTVVTSAGNEGDGSYTVGSPASASEVIAVGATTNAHQLLSTVTEDPGGDDEDVYDAAVGEFPDFDGEEHPLIEWPGSDSEACTSDVTGLSGEIVLISRGSCAFSQKMENANLAGAYGVIVYNNVPGDPIGMARSTGFDDDFIPAVMVSDLDGAALLDDVADAPSTAEVTPRQIDETVTPNLMADFSSRGPAPFTDAVKPDVVAPGVNVLSSVMDFDPIAGVTGHSWELFNGTSMASPHVAGAAALLLDDHPDWTPEQVKSALVTTATVLNSGLTVWDQGGGLIQLAPDDGAGDATVFFYPANASFGGFTGRAPANGSVDIAITGGTCSLAATSGDLVSASISGSTLNVEFEGGRDAPSGLYSGYISLDCGGDDYHIPWGAVIDR